jgi:DNA modification methylase
MNRLYYGDNLDVLRRHVEDESVDLVYLDPPFNSNASYNVLFAEKDGTRAASQIKAFEDTWEWNEDAARAFEEIVESGGRVSIAMQAFRTLLSDSDMMAYLAMMAPRLVELRRTLKPTGSLYLHCDPTASHYLKMLLDAVFGASMFRNEIVWQRTGAHSSSKRFGPIHDTILFYEGRCVRMEPRLHAFAAGDCRRVVQQYRAGHWTQIQSQHANGAWRSRRFIWKAVARNGSDRKRSALGSPRLCPRCHR